MDNLIKRDGWNKDNEAIQDLMWALKEAAGVAYGVENCTVASTFGTPEGLLGTLKDVIRNLEASAEFIESEIESGRGEPDEEDEEF